MKKKLSLLILIVSLLFMVFNPNLEASEKYDKFPNWEFYPLGINYLNHNNYTVYDDEYNMQFYSNYFVRVKPEMDYHITIYKSELATFRGVKVMLFNESKQKITELTQYNLEGIHYSFTTTSETCYLKLYINLELLDSLTKPDKIDQILVMYEGEQLNAPFNEEELRYQGSYVGNDIYENNKFIHIIKEFDETLLLSNLLESVKAYDDHDGEITNKILVEYDGYSDNHETLGSHEVILGVRDNNNNYSRLTFVILNVDTTPPEIQGQDFYETNPNEGLNVESIKRKLFAMDNYDGDISDRIELIEDNYSANKHQLGTYRLTYQVKDFSLNTTNFVVNVKVVDTEAPIILGPQQIRKKISEELTLEDIKSYFIALDNYDGDITDRIEVIFDEYSHNMYRYGSYEISFVVTDSSGNTQTFYMEVVIEDDIAPVFIVDQTMINLSLKNNPLNIDEVINLLVKANQINNPENIIILEDEYSNNNTQPGTYKVVFQEDDEVLEVVINLTDEQVEVPQSETTKTNIFNKILNSIKNFWQKFKNFFTRK